MHTLPPLKRSPFPFKDGKAKCKITDEATEKIVGAPVPTHKKRKTTAEAAIFRLKRELEHNRDNIKIRYPSDTSIL